MEVDIILDPRSLRQVRKLLPWPYRALLDSLFRQLRNYARLYAQLGVLPARYVHHPVCQVGALQMSQGLLCLMRGEKAQGSMFFARWNLPHEQKYRQHFVVDLAWCQSDANEDLTYPLFFCMKPPRTTFPFEHGLRMMYVS